MYKTKINMFEQSVVKNVLEDVLGDSVVVLVFSFLSFYSYFLIPYFALFMILVVKICYK